MKNPTCRICDGDTTIEFLKEEGPEVMAINIVFVKLCNPHAEELQTELTKIEVGRATA